MAYAVREQQGCVELCPGTDNESPHSLHVRISGYNNMSDFVVDACYWHSGQEKVDEPHCRQLEDDSCFQALVLMGCLTTQIPAGRATSRTQAI